ncbi:MAG TPA: mechanosensitive ion channel domain-containing protein [Chitinophagaceae bacterium]|nr:mechanosensitive ion channel domain-containing protein [Chitinophagaceae bacterium]
MNDFLEEIVLSNPVKNYLIVFGVILFVLLLKRSLSRYLAGLLFALLNRIWKNLDKQSFKNLVAQPLGLFVLILVSIIALHKLKFPVDWNIELYDYSLKRIIHCIGTIVLIISFIWLLLRTIDFISSILEKKASLTPDRTDDHLVVFFRDFFKVIIFIIGILMILKFAFRLNIGNLLTGLSIIGAAVALALRESLENLIASFIIFFDKPFILGDLVKVQNITGNVEKIGLRSTRIRTDQKTHVTVPNKQMVDSILDNLSLRTQLKGELRLQIALPTSSSQLENLIAGIKKILQHDKVENFTVAMNDIAVNAFQVNADYFTPTLTYLEFITLKEEINLKALKLMEELKIEIAGSSTEIRLKNESTGNSAG